MNPEQLEAWFDSRIGLNFPKDQKRFLQALDLLGHPERDFASIQLGGTNGKGSTQAFLGQILQDQGLKVGSFTSPHLEDMRERVRLNGELIPLADLQRIITQIQQAEAQMELGPLSYFELWTCVAFLYFSQEAVDVALLEVGIGGRQDATNVVASDLALITSLGLDHQEVLGDSLEAIAWEKAGLVNPQQLLLLGPLRADLLPIFEAEAAPYGNLVYQYGRDFVWQDGSFEAGDFRLDQLELGLLGDFQQENAALALMAAHSWMTLRGLALNPAQARASLSRVSWPGRLEVARPGVYLDGAHNVPAMKRLVAFVQAHNWADPIFLLGFLPRKNYTDMLVYLQTHLPQADFYLVPFEGGLKDGLSLGLDLLEKDLVSFIGIEERRPIFITGSLHFIGQVRKGLISE